MIKRYRWLIICVIFFVVFLSMNVVYAESGKLSFCQYVGTRRAFKLLGYALLILKILIPIILMAMCIYDLIQVVFSGKSEGLTKAFQTFIKRLIAAIVVFIIPTLIDAVFTLLVGSNNPDLTVCTTCLFNTSSCYVPTNARAGDICETGAPNQCSIKTP